MLKCFFKMNFIKNAFYIKNLAVHQKNNKSPVAGNIDCSQNHSIDHLIYRDVVVHKTFGYW